MDRCPETLPRAVSPAEVEAAARFARQARAWTATSGRVDTLPGDGVAGVHDEAALRAYLARRVPVVSGGEQFLLASALGALTDGVAVTLQDRDALIATIRALPVAR